MFQNQMIVKTMSQKNLKTEKKLWKLRVNPAILFLPFYWDP